MENPYEYSPAQPDLNRFTMPYKLYGKVDLALAVNKYLKLGNQSKGLIERLRQW